MSQVYTIKNEDGTIAKQVTYNGDQNLLDQLIAFQALNNVKFGHDLHGSFTDVVNKLIDSGAKYV